MFIQKYIYNLTAYCNLWLMPKQNTSCQKLKLCLLHMRRRGLKLHILFYDMKYFFFNGHQCCSHGGRCWAACLGLTIFTEHLEQKYIVPPSTDFKTVDCELIWDTAIEMIRSIKCLSQTRLHNTNSLETMPHLSNN